jgi:tetratricopeptide (TPR) repeat protein
MVEGEFSEAEEYLQEALAIAKYSGDPYRQADSLRMLGILAHERGDFDSAETYFKESISISKEINNQLQIGFINCDLGNLAFTKGEVREAVQQYHAAIQKGFVLDLKLAILIFVETLSYLSLFFKRTSDEIKAIELATLTQDHPDLHPHEKSKMTKLLSDLRKEMTEEDFTAAQERGRARDLVSTAEEMLAILEKGDLV